MCFIQCFDYRHVKCHVSVNLVDTQRSAHVILQNSTVMNNTDNGIGANVRWLKKTSALYECGCSINSVWIRLQSDKDASVFSKPLNSQAEIPGLTKEE
jgi:hypothetical protein